MFIFTIFMMQDAFQMRRYNFELIHTSGNWSAYIYAYVCVYIYIYISWQILAVASSVLLLDPDDMHASCQGLLHYYASKPDRMMA